MNIADIGSPWQPLLKWWRELTFAGIGAFVTWVWNLRKANHEISKLKLEIADLKHESDLQDAVVILRRRADALLLQTNLPSLSRAEWASCLPDPLLIDEALTLVKATREHGKDDRWIIR